MRLKTSDRVGSFIVALLFSTSFALAQQSPAVGSPDQAGPVNSIWTNDRLARDWSGARAKARQDGVDLGLELT